MSAPLDGPAALRHLAAPRVEPDRGGVAPGDGELRTLLDVATNVPDHGTLRPWRFVVVRGAGRDRFGDALVAGLFEERGGELPGAVVEKMRKKAFAAPCCVVLIASSNPESNVPVWEQEASAACTGYAIVLGAHALGFGAVWKSAATVDAPAVRRFFDLGEHERLLGWVNLGTPAPARRRRQPETARPAREEVARVIEGDAARPFVDHGALAVTDP